MITTETLVIHCMAEMDRVLTFDEEHNTIDYLNLAVSLKWLLLQDPSAKARKLAKMFDILIWGKVL